MSNNFSYITKDMKINEYRLIIYQLKNYVYGNKNIYTIYMEDNIFRAIMKYDIILIKLVTIRYS